VGDTDEEAYIAKTFAFRYLAVNDSMKDSDGDLLSFYDDIAVTSIGYFMQTEMRINERNFEDAQTILNSMDVSDFNAVEYAYYSFYGLSLKFNNSDEEFTLEDLDALIYLASLCPGDKGGVVHQARALYQLITGDIFCAVDNCEHGGERPAAPKSKDSQTAYENWDVRIIPNPNSGSFVIICGNEKEIIEISIYDISGRIVYYNNIQTKPWLK
jgi:hypothetical protein